MTDTYENEPELTCADTPHPSSITSLLTNQLLEKIVKEIRKKENMDKGSQNPLRLQYRSLVPLAVSKAIKKAVEEQTSLFNF